jgi:hypothetical protein
MEHAGRLYQTKVIWNQRNIVYLKVLTSEKRGGLTVTLFDGFRFQLFTLKFSNISVQPSSCERPKLLSEPCFYYLQTIIVYQ